MSIGQIDKTAASLLDRHSSDMLKKYSPRSVYGDGNCCYRAAALALFGTQELHSYVRLMTALEMIEHRQYYDLAHRQYIGHLRDDRVETPGYKDLIESVVTMSKDAELMHFFGISAAFRVAVRSYIPPMPAFGSIDSPYNMLVIGREVHVRIARSFTLMWTPMSMPHADEPFNPGHIILLVPLPGVNNTNNGSDNDCLAQDAMQVGVIYCFNNTSAYQY
jgi:hypothetical protein